VCVVCVCVCVCVCDIYWRLVVNVLRTIEYVNKICINYVTMCSSVTLEKLVVTQIVNIFFLFFSI